MVPAKQPRRSAIQCRQLPDESAHKVSLEELLDRGPVAVIFHRGHWCPYCRININALVEAHKALPDSADIVAIMPDRQKFVADLKTAVPSAIPNSHRRE
jgi:peroxiredoxin